jgi:polyhydroxybutyrate depolymerase
MVFIKDRRNEGMKKLDVLTRMVLLAGLAALGAEACGQSSNGAGSSGGSPGSGGTTATTVGTGGGEAAGGAVSGGSGGNGTVAGSGGAKGGGGSQGTGGNTATDAGGTKGAPGTGGIGAGGGAGTGGAPTLGGSTGSGGGSGGATGGTSNGGTSGTGGTSGSATCPAGLAKPADGKKTILVGTTSRSYYLHVPAKYDGTKPAPLVVDFHGLGGDGTSEAGSNPYKAVIDPEGVVSAYPDGVNGTNGTGWNLGPCCTSVDDVAFAKALVQDVAKVACIDLKRVYAVGYSLGGGMVHVLGCNAADVFAAISPAASDLIKETVDSCKPVRPIAEITFRGTADSAVAYGGGSMGSFTNIGAVATFQKWAEIDQCTGSPSAADSNGCSTYSSCAAGVQVTLCTKQGGGHDPGNANVSWPVLKKYSLP